MINSQPFERDLMHGYEVYMGKCDYIDDKGVCEGS